MITVDEANALLREYLSQPHMLDHSRESEVILRGLARHFGANEDLWGMTGLLHDLDYEMTVEDLPNHGLKTPEILKEAGYDIPEMFQAIRSHNEMHTGVKRESRLDFALAAGENVTGLIVAYTLMRPDKDLMQVSVKSLNKKFKQKSFAASVNREYIDDIQKIGLERSQFLDIALKAMQKIKDEITL